MAGKSFIKIRKKREPSAEPCADTVDYRSKIKVVVIGVSKLFAIMNEVMNPSGDGRV